MSEEEKEAIEEQYKKGLVNLGNIIEPLIRQFKNDYSLDIQQLRLVTNYLLLEREFNEDYYSELDRELEKLQKEIEELKQITILYNSYEVPNERKIVIADSEYFVRGFFKENFIHKDKIRSLLKQVNTSLYHFKDSDKNNIMQRIKDRLEELLEEK